MAHREPAVWPGDPSGQTREVRLGGRYRTYVPDRLDERPLLLPSGLARRVADVEARVRELASSPAGPSLDGLSRFLLRGEALASSRIEGLQVSPQQLALGEVADEEGLGRRGVSAAARLVVANVRVVREAVGRLADAAALTTEDVVRLHDDLLADDGFPGLRSTQNWVGGRTPVSAEFVPPAPGLVAPLVEDLADYCSGAAHAALVQAALAHAQFETVHPFADGNGRVGRALIHTVLKRRGLLRGAVLPVSLVLLTRVDDYVAGLTAFRHDGLPTSAAAQDGLVRWLEVFIDAAGDAADRAAALAEEVEARRADWRERLAGTRDEAGLRAAPRSDSAAHRLLEVLPEVPVLTVRSGAALLNTSGTATRRALDQLVSADVLRTRRLGRATVYLADEVLSLLTLEERRLASTRHDTGASRPRRPVPPLSAAP